MITINLAKRLKTAGGAGKIDFKNLDVKQLVPLLLGLLKPKQEQATGDKKNILASPVAKAVLAAGAAYLLQDTIETWKKEELAKLDSQVSVVERENVKLKTELGKYANFETRKAQFETEINTLKTKLEVLGKLMGGRNTPVKMMRELSSNLPSDVWLNDYKVAEREVVFTGQTASYPSVSEFMKAMASSQYLSKVTLRGIQEVAVSGATQKDMKVQEFTIAAERKETM